VFTARYGLIPYIKQTLLDFITEVESVYSAVRTDSLYKADTFGFISKVESVYSAVRTDSLHKADTFGFYNRGGECLQRGTDWVFK
jgi:hypothetical protein